MIKTILRYTRDIEPATELSELRSSCMGRVSLCTEVLSLPITCALHVIKFRQASKDDTENEINLNVHALRVISRIS